MQESLMHSSGRRSYTISRDHIVCLIVLIILNIPGFLIDITTIYHTEHRFLLGDFAYLNYDFTVFELLLIIWALLIFPKKSHGVHMLPVMAVVALKEIFLFLLGKPNVFTFNSYEMYFCVFVAISCNDIICKETNDSLECINYFLDLLIVFNFIWQLLFLVSGKIAFGDRVNAMSMGYGPVGYLCAMHILYILLVREKTRKETILIAIGFISIILSGSRYNLLISLLGILMFSHYILRNTSRQARRWITLAIIFLIVALLIVIINPNAFGASRFFNRVLNLFQGGNFIQNISNDESFVGRVLSIQIGFDLIKENPLGISNSFIDIQGKTIEHGFFSFPHSNLLTYYLLWGLAFLACLVWFIKICKKASRHNNKGIMYFMIAFMVSNTIYGGVDTAPKVYTYLFLLMSAIALSLRNQEIEQE